MKIDRGPVDGLDWRQLMGAGLAGEGDRLGGSAVQTARPEVGGPPLLIGGVQVGGGDWTDFNVGGPPAFDYYRATVYRKPDQVIDMFKEYFGPRAVDWNENECRANGYERLVVVECFHKRLLQILYGGKQAWPLVDIYGGGFCMEGVKLLRTVDHRPSRIDAKFDLKGGEEVWVEVTEFACGLLGKIANPPRPHFRICPLGIGGNTGEYGSRKNRAYLRHYEKAKQLRAVHGVSLPVEVNRIEVELKEEKHARANWTEATPEQVLCVTPFARALYERFGGSAVEFIPSPGRRGAKDMAQSALQMVAQYRNVLKQINDAHETDAERWQFLEYLFEEADELRRERALANAGRRDAMRTKFGN